MYLVKVFKHDGSLQCGYRKGRSLDDMADELKQIGGDVKSVEQGHLPVIMVCGAPTGSVAVCAVTTESWEEVKRGFVGTNGWAIWPYTEETSLVYKYDGTLQCGEGDEITLETMAEELTKSGVKVVSMKKGTDGLFHLAVCGGSTGSVNIFEIQENAVQKAEDLGFRRYVGRDTFDSTTPTADDLWPYPWQPNLIDRVSHKCIVGHP